MPEVVSFIVLPSTTLTSCYRLLELLGFQCHYLLVKKVPASVENTQLSTLRDAGTFTEVQGPPTGRTRLSSMLEAAPDSEEQGCCEDSTSENTELLSQPSVCASPRPCSPAQGTGGTGEAGGQTPAAGRPQHAPSPHPSLDMPRAEVTL